ncbi:MAG: DUF2971 domain-containing protein [Thermoleophilia bacterium]
MGIPDGLKVRLETGAEEMSRLLFDLDPEPPELIYHYTSAEGVLGILSSGELWATHVGHMNDSSELRYGLDLVLGRLAALDLAKRSEEFFVWSEILQDRLVQLGDRMDFYLSCFCQKPDLLSQWRAYGGNGVGYAIGLNARALPAGNQQPTGAMWARPVDIHPASFFVKVEYSRELHERLVGVLVDVAVQMAHDVFLDPAFVSGDIPLKRETLSELAGLVSGVAASTAIRIKNPAFEEEQEWRLVALAESEFLPQKQGFRTAGGTVVPFVPIRIRPSGLEAWSRDTVVVQEVWCGPSSFQDRAEHGLRRLLRHHGLGDCTIHRSTTPLRSRQRG